LSQLTGLKYNWPPQGSQMRVFDPVLAPNIIAVYE